MSRLADVPFRIPIRCDGQVVLHVQLAIELLNVVRRVATTWNFLIFIVAFHWWRVIGCVHADCLTQQLLEACRRSAPVFEVATTQTSDRLGRMSADKLLLQAGLRPVLQPTLSNVCLCSPTTRLRSTFQGFPPTDFTPVPKVCEVHF